MKISVLIPTRNRLFYLKIAIETVLRQGYQDWEIIVSDNFSEEDIGSYIQSLNDDRIKYHRTSKFIPVTDNWNNALKYSTGEYVIMLGDDDGLIKNYFTEIKQLIVQYDFPDCICHSALLFAYPKVLPDYPNGSLRTYSYAYPIFKKSVNNPRLIDKHESLKLVKSSMNFRLRFGYNMQFYTISRKFIESLQSFGEFFQSPYPDYYASNVIFAKAKTVLIYPKPIVIIGITPKSFGFYFVNKQEDQGISFLNNIDKHLNHKLRHILLPGSDHNTSWLLSMELLKQNYCEELKSNVSYKRYRFLQIFYVYRYFYLNPSLHQFNVKRFWQSLNYYEKLFLILFLGLHFSIISLLLFFPVKLRKKILFKIELKLQSIVDQYPLYQHKKSKKVYQDIMDVFENFISDSDFE